MLLRFHIKFIEIIDRGNTAVSVGKQFHNLIADGKKKNSNCHK